MLKNNKYRLLACLVVLSLMVTSCSDLEDFNENDRNITQEQLEVDFQHVGSKYKPVFESIYQENKLKFSKTIHLPDCPSWTYYLRLKNDKEIKFVKIIVN